MMKAICAGAACALLLVTATAQAAVTAQQKCEQAKLKAQGRLQLCLKKNGAKVIAGKADASALCEAKFQTGLQKADDRAAAAATSCRYVDNLDGTVDDLNTGLVWEQKTTTVGSGVNLADAHDVDNTYGWSTGSPYGPTGTVFSDFLYELNGATSEDGASSSGCFTGHCDWRLPTIEELQTLLLQAYLCGTDPCIDPALGPTQSFAHWSSSTDSSVSDLAWGVSFDVGSLYVASKQGSYYYVRAVRGGL